MAAEPSPAQKRMFAKMGLAMPDGSHHIRNGPAGAADLASEIKAAGDGPDQKNAEIRKHIMVRAKKLDLYDNIPKNWNPDGSLKQSAVEAGQDFIAHFGTKGMRWGVRKPGTGAASDHVSSDAARAHALKSTVSKHGTSALSNVELQHLVTRLNLEKQHGQLNPAHVSNGHRILNEVLKVGGNVAKQQATTYASQYAQKGIEHLIKGAA